MANLKHKSKKPKLYLMLLIAFMLPFQSAWAKKEGKDKKKEHKKPKVEAIQPAAQAPASASLVSPGTDIITVPYEVVPMPSDVMTVPSSEVRSVCWQALVPQSNADKWNALTLDAQFAAILLMIGNSFTPNFVAKDLVENSRLNLGIPFEGNRTLDLEYVYDTRHTEGVLRLLSISIVDAFGSSKTLLKDPFDPITGALRPIKETDKLTAEEYATAVFPLSIDGKLLKKILDSKNWLENVSHDEMREYAYKSLFRLKMKSMGRSLRRFVGKDFVKHSFRIATFGAVIVGLTQLTNIIPAYTGKGSVVNEIFHMYPVAIGGGEASAEVQQPALTTSQIKESQTFEAAEKAWLLTELENNGGRNTLATMAVMLKMNARVIPADVINGLWIYVESTEQIYMANVTVTSDAGVSDSKIGGLIEIPVATMPTTYATVKNLFVPTVAVAQ